MKKLNSQKIDKIISEYQNGVLVSELAIKNGVSKLTIYYHIRRGGYHKKLHPSCYRDYIVNSILRIEEKIRVGYYTEEKLPFALAELKRLKFWLREDRHHLPDDAFILQ